ncbi:thioesterase II family protein [Nonomuraea basaltis]|uniref:thioesterase II family protein n=1 Tax=Nonomuraea basaltis TaxID=2495887 RepID=UPI00110C52B8|nr:alpha/beta fold hydrolase [Nonomuraea basaltis]TMR90116.1 alpha/beta fold hydrolase [Nonomuraea basaltis]
MSLQGGFRILRRDGAEVRLLMFHHAGGSAASYHQLASRLPPWCEPCLFELPGRGVRSGEPFAPDYASAAGPAVAAVVSTADRPTVLFGHSLGALLAHTVACDVPEPARKMIRSVVFSACPPPGWVARRARHPSGPFLLWPAEALDAELRRRGGCPKEVFEHPDLLRYARTVLSQDMHLVDTYRAPSGELAGGDHRLWLARDDLSLPPGTPQGWTDDLGVAPGTRWFGGGHFYLDTHRSEVAAALANLAEQARSFQRADHQESSNVSCAGPFDVTESEMLAIAAEAWRAVLGVTDVSAADDFFALGGTSILATKAVVLVQRRVSRRIRLRTLLEYPRLADFAAAVIQEK